MNLLLRIKFNLNKVKCKLLLKYKYKIGYFGNNVFYSKGFNVFNGSKNIHIKNHVSLINTTLNAGEHKGKITIGNNVFFGHDVMILARGHDYSKLGIERSKTVVEKPVVIEDGVWIGSRAVVLPGVTIGENSVIGAGSIVTKNVKANSVYFGVPAKFVKKIK